MKTVILSMISTAVVSGFGIYCLLNGLLEGTESVVLILGGVFVAFIVYFSSDIQEISFGGNILKLRELNNEALKTIDLLKSELNNTKIEIMRLRLQQILSNNNLFGDFSNSKVEKKVYVFLKIYQKIDEENCIFELKNEIEAIIRVLITSQYNKLKIIHNLETKKPNDNLDDLWLPRDLSLKLSDEIINSIVNYQGDQSTSYLAVKADIFHAIDAYTQLYIILKKLEKNT